jgi:hypothetical protein
MDVHRLAGDDELTKHYAATVIRENIAPDGSQLAPMRISECRLSLAVVAGREGDLEQAVDLGRQALEGDRKSLPSMTMVAAELDAELRRRYPDESLTQEFREALRALA